MGHGTLRCSTYRWYAIHQGKVAEMQTGEGKTLVATLPVYLNALAGNGVHLVTVMIIWQNVIAHGWRPF